MIIPFDKIIIFGFLIYLFYSLEATFPQNHYKFIIGNSGHSTAIVKKVTIDGKVYLNHKVTINPVRTDVPLQDKNYEDKTLSIRVFRPQVKSFAMTVEENGKEESYFCDLIVNDNGGRIFFISFGGGMPLTSPLESSFLFD